MKNKKYYIKFLYLLLILFCSCTPKKSQNSQPSSDYDNTPLLYTDSELALKYRNIVYQKIREFTPSKNKRIKVAFFDLDSTLRITVSGRITPSSPNDILIIPHVVSRLVELNRLGYLIAVISNQGNIYLKRDSFENVDMLFKHTIILLERGGAAVNYYDFAAENDNRRKPNIGMALKLEKVLNQTFGKDVAVDKDHSFMVGDAAYNKGELRLNGEFGLDFSNSDRLFANNYGIRFFDPADFFGWKIANISRVRSQSDLISLKKHSEIISKRKSIISFFESLKP